MAAGQADLLKKMEEGEDIKSDDIAELRWATDLSLRANRETARAIGQSMAALVATKRNLWLTLSNIKEKDRVFLIEAQLALSGLFGDAVNTVVYRFQVLFTVLMEPRTTTTNKFLSQRSPKTEHHHSCSPTKRTGSRPKS